MNWKKLGVIWNTEKDDSLRQGAMIPTPVVLPETNRIRIYYSVRDKHGRGLPYFIEVNSQDPTEILSEANGPLIQLGSPGTFDANGAVVCSVVKVSKTLWYMYYVGFEIPTDIRYRMFVGLAISNDGGITFKKYSKAPVLDRSDSELFFRCGPFLMHEGGIFKLWYIAGSKWMKIDETLTPSYDLKYLESEDGIAWGEEGKTILSENFENYGYGRPWIYNYAGKTHMIISARKRAQKRYELENYQANSEHAWNRLESSLVPSLAGVDDLMISYASVVQVDGRFFCFYNGNNFGETGICLAQFS